MRHFTPAPPKTREQLAIYFNQRAARFALLGKVRMVNVYTHAAEELRTGSKSIATVMREVATHIEYMGLSLPPEERRV